MEDERFAEVIRPLLAGALERAGAEAAEDAAIAAWRAFPRLKNEGDAGALFERALARAGPPRDRSVLPKSWSDEVIAIASSHERRSPLVAHAPLAAALLISTVAMALAAGPRLGALISKTPSGQVEAQAVTPLRDKLIVLTTPTPLAPPERYYGPAPGGPLIWGIDSRQPTWLIAFNQAGAPVGTLLVPLHGSAPNWTLGPLAASADGATLWTGARFVDRWGNDLGSPAISSGSFVWSDSPDQVCAASSTVAGMWTLWTFRLRGATAPFAHVHADNLVLAGCSFNRDLAVVVEMGRYEAFDYVHRIDFIRLSSGAVVGARTEPGTSVESVVTSPDLRYFAENAAAWPQPLPVRPTIVRRVDDGATVLTLKQTVTAFSSDSRQVATGIFNGGPGPIYDLATAGVALDPGTIRPPRAPAALFAATGAWVLAGQEVGFGVLQGSVVTESDYGQVTMITTTGPFQYSTRLSGRGTGGVQILPAVPDATGPGLTPARRDAD